MTEVSKDKETETNKIFATRANLSGTVVFLLAVIKDGLGVIKSKCCLDGMAGDVNILIGSVELIIPLILWIIPSVWIDSLNHNETVCALSERNLFEIVTAFSAVLFGVEKIFNMAVLKEFCSGMRDSSYMQMFVYGLILSILIIIRSRSKKSEGI